MKQINFLLSFGTPTQDISLCTHKYSQIRTNPKCKLFKHFRQGILNLCHEMPQKHSLRHCSIISPSLVTRSTLAQCYSLLHNFHIEKNNTSLKSQLSSATHLHSSWKIRVKYSALRRKQGTKRVREIHHCGPELFLIHTKCFPVMKFNDAAPWGCRTIFTDTCQ